MKNLSLPALFLVFAFTALLSCNSGGGNPGSSTSGKKYLARNIIMNVNPAASPAYAQEQAVDTQTQILASNVIVEPMSASQIQSSNVQDALQEISLKLPEVMVGTWNIQNYNQENTHQATGQVTINSDGTFNLTAGSFAAIGMGSDPTQATQFPLPTCGHTVENQTFQAFTDDLILFIHYNPAINPPVQNAVIPRLVRLRQNEIIFVGEGGCGETGRQRISILTRV